MRWSEFAEACPEIAALARERLAKGEVVMLGTFGKDGSPRISPVEPDVAAGHLSLGMMWRSRKALDLLCDPRCVVRSAPSDRMNPGPASSSTGRRRTSRAALRQEYRDAIRARIDWPPAEPSYHLFPLAITAVAYVGIETKLSES